MYASLNGALLPENQAVVSVSDRGFLYGDGLFTTLRVRNGRPFRWSQHQLRLRRGADFLRISLPWSEPELQCYARELITANNSIQALLRITVTRGVSSRGYSTQTASSPTLVMTTHAAPVLADVPQCWRLRTSTSRLPAGDTLACCKTCNKLPQILARAEAEAAGSDEALFLNTNDELAEAASGNVFWIDGNTVCTPPLNSGILPGVTRELVLDLCAATGICTQVTPSKADALHRASGVFLTLSSQGIVEVTQLDGVALCRSPLVARLFTSFLGLLAKECPPPAAD